MEEIITNDTAALNPVVTSTDRHLNFDFPALWIGIGEYPEGPTGCTVYYFPAGAFGVVDIGSIEVGTVNTEYLLQTGGPLHAICLAGGSLNGLEAAAGVTSELFARSGYSREHGTTPLVAGAITHDFDTRDNVIYPDKALGKAAIRAARTGLFPLGQHGSGSCLSVGKGICREHAETSGQGGAFRQMGPTKIAFFTNVNALGALVDREGNVVRGNFNPETQLHYHLWEALTEKNFESRETQAKGRNTTLSVLVTNEILDFPTLKQLARQVHSSMARGIQPFQTLFDGDTLFAVTTNEVTNPALRSSAGQGNYSDLGVIASEVAWDAILSCYSS